MIVYRQNRASAIQCDTAADLAGSVYIPARHAQVCTDTAHVLANCAHVSSGLSSVSALNSHSQSHHTVFCYLVHASVCACTRVSNPGFPEPPNPVNVDIFQFPKPKFRFNRGLWGHKTALLFVKLCELGIFSAICCTFCTIHCRSV